MLRKLFIDHPQSVNETYLQHMGSATRFGSCMILAGFACLIHGILPTAFTTTGSRMIRRLHDQMIAHRARPEAGTGHGPVHQSAVTGPG
jgi:hypothetical protein